MAAIASTVTPIMDEFKMRELLAHTIRRDVRKLLLATAGSVSKRPVRWSEVKALLPLPIDKSLAMMLIAETGLIEYWDI
jgi:hypothetical protein